MGTPGTDVLLYFPIEEEYHTETSVIKLNLAHWILGTKLAHSKRYIGRPSSGGNQNKNKQKTNHINSRVFPTNNPDRITLCKDNSS